MVKFIKVSVETHNTDDPYYTNFKDIILYTEKDYSDKDIENILESINIKRYEDTTIFSYGETEIDLNDLINQLSEYKIFLLKFNIEKAYYLEED